LKNVLPKSDIFVWLSAAFIKVLPQFSRRDFPSMPPCSPTPSETAVEDPETPQGWPPGTGGAGIEVVGGVVSRMTGWRPEVRAMRLLIALMMLFVCCVAGGCGVPTPNENFQTAYNAAKKSD